MIGYLSRFSYNFLISVRVWKVWKNSRPVCERRPCVVASFASPFQWRTPRGSTIDSGCLPETPTQIEKGDLKMLDDRQTFQKELRDNERHFRHERHLPEIQMGSTGTSWFVTLWWFLCVRRREKWVSPNTARTTKLKMPHVNPAAFANRSVANQAFPNSYHRDMNNL